MLSINLITVINEYRILCFSVTRSHAKKWPAGSVSTIIFPDENRVCHAQVSVYFRLGTVSIFRGRQVDDLQSEKLSIPPPHKHDIIFLEVWSARPSAPTSNTIGSAMSIVQKAIIIIPVITAVTVFILPVTARITTSLARRKERQLRVSRLHVPTSQIFCLENVVILLF